MSIPKSKAFTLRTFSLILGFAVLSSSQAAFAQAKRPSAGSSGARPAPAGGEQSKKVKFKDKTELNFEDAAIDGQIKNPFATLMNSRDQDFGGGFIKLRNNWHDQMIMSVNGLSQ